MRMPMGMKSVNDRAKMTGFLTGPGHPIARKMARSIEDSGEAMQSGPGGPPNFRDAEGEAGGDPGAPEGENCGLCRDYLEGEMEGSGKCNRYGVDTDETKVCDAFAPSDTQEEQDEPEEEMAGKMA